MKLLSLSFNNFRSYRDEIKIDFSDLTVFVGRNDIGKSTILEALDIFFNEGSGLIKFDKNDINIFSSREGISEFSIKAVFDDLPSEIVIDEAYKTSLSSEFLLNKDKKLEVIKKFRQSGKPSVYVNAHHPTNDLCKDLLHKKNSDLKKLLQDRLIPCDNLSVNSCMRKAIWDYYSSDLQLELVEIDTTKEGAKQIWDKLSKYLPIFSLFQSDRKNSDGDDEVQDPLKEAVKQIISEAEMQNKLAEVADIVLHQLNEVASRTLCKIKEMDSGLAESLNPVIPPNNKLKWVDVFKSVSICGDDDIPINKRGSGVKRLILLNFFRAEAERIAESIGQSGIIYAVEEPETSQHFNNQYILISAFKQLSKNQNTQIILTTHSPIIVKALDYDNVRLILNSDGVKKVINIEPSMLAYKSLNEINYLAYEDSTEEYHDELYGFLVYHKLLDNYNNGLSKRKYIKEKDNRRIEQYITLTDYIRHQIHHPENINNPRYTREELKASINDMRNFIIALKKSSSNPFSEEDEG